MNKPPCNQHPVDTPPLGSLAESHPALAYEKGMTDAFRHASGRKRLSQDEANKRGRLVAGWGKGFNYGMEIERSKKIGYQKTEK